MSTESSASVTPLLTRDAPFTDGVPNRPYRDPGWERIASGVHVSTTQWAEASVVARHLACIKAAQRKYGEELVLVGVSAALALGMPIVGRIPRRVQCLGRPGQRRRISLLERHEITGCHPVVWGAEGLRTVPLTVLLVRLAAGSGLVAGVAAMDHALRHGMCTRSALLEAAEALPVHLPGRAQAVHAVHLADGRAESPGESLSRVRMWQARLPRPDLQCTVTPRGDPTSAYRVDFIWQDLGVVGEFDGRVKYQRQSFGQDPQEVLWQEKQRERELIRMGLQVARWTWNEAWRDDGAIMLRELARLGVLPGRRRW